MRESYFRTIRKRPIRYLFIGSAQKECGAIPFGSFSDFCQSDRVRVCNAALLLYTLPSSAVIFEKQTPSREEIFLILGVRGEVIARAVFKEQRRFGCVRVLIGECEEGGEMDLGLCSPLTPHRR